jgi:hypothetical protein
VVVRAKKTRVVAATGVVCFSSTGVRGQYDPLVAGGAAGGSPLFRSELNMQKTELSIFYQLASKGAAYEMTAMECHRLF